MDVQIIIFEISSDRIYFIQIYTYVITENPVYFQLSICILRKNFLSHTDSVIFFRSVRPSRHCSKMFHPAHAKI